MKFTRVLTAALLGSTIAGAAMAADLPVRTVAPAFVAPAPILSWTGFYVGLNGGYTWNETSNINYVGVPNTPPFFADFGIASNALISARRNGFIGGGQIGWNYQFSPAFVGGLEADIQGIAGSSSNVNAAIAYVDPVPGQPPMIMSYGGSKSLSYLGTVRGRLGWLPTPSLLLYGTGGLAYGGAKLTSTWNLLRPALAPAFSPDIAATSASATRVGWTVGAGAEWKFASNWSARLEYLYYDLGRLTTPATILVDSGNGNPLAVNASSARFNGHVVRAGLNYAFNFGGVPVARY